MSGSNVSYEGASNQVETSIEIQLTNRDRKTVLRSRFVSWISIDVSTWFDSAVLLIFSSIFSCCRSL